MGANHARVLAATKGSELVGVHDADPSRAELVADLHGCRALPRLDDVIDVADAVVVAVPTALHAEIACALLDAGVHCLVEKPYVASEEQASAVADAAARGNAAVLVGHIERFNPAVRQLHEILADGHRILAVEAHRMSAVSGRVTDIDVVTDLMVHDIDIVTDLVKSPVVDVTARGVAFDGSPGEDYVTAILTFGDGSICSLTASRITQNQVRSLRVTTDRRLLTVDYSNQELLIYRQGRIGGLGADGDASRYVLDVGTERVFVRRVEPLVAEISHFLEVAGGSSDPMINMDHALAVMRIVWAIRAEVASRG
jgi:predicted dehydrogenase